jgi:hypothetical protein
MLLKKHLDSALNTSRKWSPQRGECGMTRKTLPCTMKYWKEMGTFLDWMLTLRLRPTPLFFTMQWPWDHGVSEITIVVFIYMEDLKFVHRSLAMKDHCWARWKFYLGLGQFFLYSLLTLLCMMLLGINWYFVGFVWKIFISLTKDKGNNIICTYKTHYEKKGYFAIGLATQFLSCKRHLQLIEFIRCEC